MPPSPLWTIIDRADHAALGSSGLDRTVSRTACVPIIRPPFVRCQARRCPSSRALAHVSRPTIQTPATPKHTSSRRNSNVLAELRRPICLDEDVWGNRKPRATFLFTSWLSSSCALARFHHSSLASTHFEFGIFQSSEFTLLNRSGHIYLYHKCLSNASTAISARVTTIDRAPRPMPSCPLTSTPLGRQARSVIHCSADSEIGGLK